MTYTHGWSRQDRLEETKESSQVFQKTNASGSLHIQLLNLSQVPFRNQSNKLHLCKTWHLICLFILIKKQVHNCEVKEQLLPRKCVKSISIIQAKTIVCIRLKCWAFFFKHQRHGISIIMQQCQQSLFINSICYLSSPACCAGEKKHSGSIENSISDGSHAAFVIHGGKERQIRFRILKSMCLGFVWVSNISANYDIPYTTSENGNNSGMLIG